MSVAAVVRQFGPAYVARFGATMPAGHRRALEDLAACRTLAMGGQVTPCDRCGHEHYVYHSRRNRSGPSCHGVSTRAWLTARETELLPVPYFHVAFTLPAELRAIVRTHQRTLLPVLMQTAAASLQALAANPHYLGGTVGMLAVLHTWTRTLVYHPHVHCLVPGGAIAPDGLTWCPARGQYLVPVRALSVGFRARFLKRLRRVLPHVVVPPTVWTTPWVVYARAHCAGRGLRAPLPRALRPPRGHHRRAPHPGGRDDRDVSLSRRPGEGGRTMTLAGEEFLRRFLQHVLPRGLHKVRYYGWWRPQAAAIRAQLQQQLAPPVAAPRLDAPPPATPVSHAPCGPQCGTGPLFRTRRLRRAPALASPP